MGQPSEALQLLNTHLREKGGGAGGAGGIVVRRSGAVWTVVRCLNLTFQTWSSSGEQPGPYYEKGAWGRKGTPIAFWDWNWAASKRPGRGWLFYILLLLLNFESCDPIIYF